jgi:hypothetical protein
MRQRRAIATDHRSDEGRRLSVRAHSFQFVMARFMRGHPRFSSRWLVSKKKHANGPDKPGHDE